MAGIIQDTSYGLSQAILSVNPAPIISVRNPKVNDKAKLGQIWINKTTAISFSLNRIAANSYIWGQAASNVAALVVAGAGTFGTTLDVTGLTTLIAGATLNAALTVTIGGAAITGNSSVTGTFGVTGVTTLTGATNVVGAITATTTITATTGLRATAGGCTITAGGLTVTAGGAGISGTTNINTATATTTSIGRGGTGVLALGNITALSSLWGLNVDVKLGDHVGGQTFNVRDDANAIVSNIDSTGNFVAAGRISATVGNITAANGDVVITTATKGVILPGPTKIITGAGIPANALAAEIGDMYIRTDANSAVTRIYIATALNTWTNLTCAA
jgi:hypothetical protein